MKKIKSKSKAIKKQQKKNFSKTFFRGISVAVLTAMTFGGYPASYAESIDLQNSILGSYSASVVFGSAGANNLLKEKAITDVTLDYLKDNNILIPQIDYQRDENGNLVLDKDNKPVVIASEPVSSPGSAYTITEGNESNHVFSCYVADENGKLTRKYYNINLTDSNGITFGNSAKVTWQEVSAEGADVVKVKLSNDVTKYFKYTYTQPSDYTTVTTRQVISPDDTISITNKTFSGSNHTTSTNSALGGAIYNNGSTISDITGDFIGNYGSSSRFLAYGGAIYNGGTFSEIYDENYSIVGIDGQKGIIGDITGDFIGNYAYSPGYHAYGGAIYNSGAYVNLDDYTYDDINDYEFYQFRGLMTDSCIIGNITGDFIGNYASSKFSAYGGAISNDIGIIGNITGDFIDNYASSPNDSAFGGAISNESGTIGNITGDFIGNNASSSNDSASGGAIYNGRKVFEIYDFNTEIEEHIVDIGTTIGDITGDFIGNYASSDSSAYGGAISNDIGIIGNITGDFIGNHAASPSPSSLYTYGGAISNESGTIGNITGDFISNYVSSSDSFSFGGAIYNSVKVFDIYDRDKGEVVKIDDAAGTIGDITGDFIGNYVSSHSYAHGGAIYNGRKITSVYDYTEVSTADVCGTIGDITGDFIGNYVSSLHSAHGGAIHNEKGIIGNMTGDFIGNYAYGFDSAFGGAIYNYSATIGNITGDFIGNYAESDDRSSAHGGAIYNDVCGTIGNITGDFIDNYVSSFHRSVLGGAIYNKISTIGDIAGNFTGNRAASSSPLSLSPSSAYTSGGAISNESGTIGNITGNFTDNYASSSNVLAFGGAISNQVVQDSTIGSTIGNITGDFIDNYVSSFHRSVLGGAISNGNGTIGNITGDFTGNYASSYNDSAFGGAIYNSGTIGKDDGGIINSNFYDNYVKSTEEISKGGAIYTNSNLNIIADKGTSTFQGNYVQVGEDSEKDYQAIYIDSSATIGFIARNSGSIYMYDNIDGANNYKLTLNGDSSSNINILGLIKNASTVSLDSIHLTFGEDTFNSSGLMFNTNSGFVDLNDNKCKTYNFDGVQSNQDVKWSFDIDFTNLKSDVINTTAASTGTIYVNDLSIINKPQEDGTYTLQIINNANSESTLQLALNSALTEKNLVETHDMDVSATITPDVAWKTVFEDVHHTYNKYGQLGLDTKSTENDSITYSVFTEKITTYSSAGDTLALWNKLSTEETKNFNFDTEDDIYFVTADIPDIKTIGITKGTELNIKGKIDSENRSTIDFNQTKGFDIKHAATLNIENVNLRKGLDRVIEVTDSNANINLTNVSLIGNNSSTAGSAIYSMSNINMTADNAESVFSGNLVNDINEAIYIANNDKTLTLNAINNGVFTLNDSINGETGYNVHLTGDKTGNINLFNNINNADVIADNVTIHLADDAYRDYTFETLNSDESANWVIGLDFSGDSEVSDTIRTNKASSGIITISDLQFVLPDHEHNNCEHEVRILFTQNNDLQLALSAELQEKLDNEKFTDYIIGTTVDKLLDKIDAETKWNKEYFINEVKTDVLGTLRVVSSDDEDGTKNDSIALVVKDTKESIINKTPVSGVLKLWWNEEVLEGTSENTPAKKRFFFEEGEENETYLVAKELPDVFGLGKAKGKEITIEGARVGNQRSTIDLNYCDGFEISPKESDDSVQDSIVLNIKDINLINGYGTAINVTDENASVKLTNTNLIGNMSSEVASAIRSNADINFITDGTETEITNNTVQGESSAIYISNNKTLTFNTVNGGILTINDIINGDKGYNVIITSELEDGNKSTGIVNLFNDINNANVIVDNVKVNLADGKAHNYTFESLKSGANANYVIDIDFANNESDKITTNNASSETIIIESLNIINGLQDDLAQDFKLQILNGTEDSSLQLALSNYAKTQLDKEYIYEQTHKYSSDDVNAVTNWKVQYLAHDDIYDNIGTLGLTTTKTENDSIGMIVEERHIDTIHSTKGDTLALWNQAEISNESRSFVEKHFNFDSEKNNYTVADIEGLKGLGETKGSVLNINGKIVDNIRSTINLNNKKGFEVKNASTLNINNVSIKNGNGGAIEIANSDAELNILNSNFKNNSAEAAGSVIYSIGDVNITADNATSEFTGNNNAIYIANRDKALTLNILNNGELTLNDSINGTQGYTVNITGDKTGTLNLFNDINNANVSVKDITVNLADGNIHNYTFESLKSDANANYKLDIDFVNNTSDKIITANASKGTITIDSLNLINGLQDDLAQDFKLQILNGTEDSSLQLALSDYAKTQLDKEYIYEQTHKYSSDDVNAVTNWKAQYLAHDDIYDNIGTLGLTTTKTENDSIGMIVEERHIDTIHSTKGDALALWNGLNTNEVKHFNFDSEENIYTVADIEGLKGLGETKGSVLNINGVINTNTSVRSKISANDRSTIDLNNKKGFEVKNASTLNINNVSIKNGNGGAIEIANSDAELNILNSNFKNNVSKTLGSAIYSKADVNITADNATSEFTGNNNAIYIANRDKALTLNTINNGKMYLNDSINGEKGYNVNIIGDKSGTFYLFNDLNNANVLLNNTTVSTVNNDIHIYNLNSLQLTGNTNFIADVDLENRSMDRFVSSAYGDNGSHMLTVTGMNLLQTGVPKEEIIAIYFAEDGLKDNVDTTVTDVAYSPIYKYKVKYDNRDDGGYFVFDRSISGAGSSNPSVVFNPSILSAPVANVAASQATINEAYQYVFEHADTFTKLPANIRKMRMNANKYAYASTDFNENRGLLRYENSNEAVWFRPYVTLESMNLYNGPKVDVTTYGSLAGFDTEFLRYKNGWNGVGTAYIGYTGSNLKYLGVDTTMNGGLLGYTHTMYKNNFWSALTLSAGASAGDSSSMYGKEDFASLMAGLGSKTGYNFEFQDGKYIIQPIMFMSYSFVNTFDYTNAANVRIRPHSAHSLQLSPSVNFIMNTKNGWQPYASVGMVWNAMNENKVMADTVRLPEIGMKPYVEYGLGVQRNWKDKFTAYVQTMIKNGGRNGISFVGGFRWILGSEKKQPVKKTYNEQSKQIVNNKKLSPITPIKKSENELK